MRTTAPVAAIAISPQGSPSPSIKARIAQIAPGLPPGVTIVPSTAAAPHHAARFRSLRDDTATLQRLPELHHLRANLVARGLGELMIGLAYGPWMVLGSLYLHTGRLSWDALWASLVPGLLIMALAVVNASVSRVYWVAVTFLFTSAKPWVT